MTNIKTNFSLRLIVIYFKLQSNIKTIKKTSILILITTQIKHTFKHLGRANYVLLRLKLQIYLQIYIFYIYNIKIKRH